MQKFDLIVVGGGILGVSHAYHALKNGLSVALLEKDSKPSSATVRNFGQVVPSGMNRKWQRLGRISLQCYKEIHQEFALPIAENGSIYIASDAEEVQLIEELAAINKEEGYTSELWTAAQCFAHYPSLKPSYCKAALFFPEDLSADPRYLIHRLLAYLQTFPNFRYFPNTYIFEIDSAGQDCKVKDLRGNVFESEQVIICSGGEVEVLYPEIFSQSDLEWVKLQMLRIAPQSNTDILGNILTGLTIRRYESFYECPSFYAIKAKEDMDSYWKKWGVHILFKQEADGSVILGDSHEYADVTNPSGLDFYLREEVNQYFIEEGKKILELENWNIDSSWLGIYTQCKTQDIFQQSIDNKVHIVTGIGGKGMTGSMGFAHQHIQNLYKK